MNTSTPRIKISAGELRHSLTLSRPGAPTAGVGGQIAHTYTNYATARARIRGLSGTEFWQARRVHAEATHEILMRYLPDVEAKDRITVADGRLFEIESVLDPDGRRVALILVCQELTDG